MEHKRKRPCEGGNRNCSYSAMRLGYLEHKKLEEARKDCNVEPSERAGPYQHFSFVLVMYRTVRK